MATKVILGVKFDEEKVTSRNDFNMWCIKMCTLLVQQGLFKALKSVDKLPERMDEKEKENLMKWTHSVILDCGKK